MSIQKVAFTMYSVEGMKLARKFYEKTLRLKPFSSPDENAWAEYDFPGDGCLPITTLAKDFTPNADAGAAIAFEVDNLEALVNKLKAEGVKIKSDIVSPPICKMAVMIDSEDNALMLHQLDKNI